MIKTKLYKDITTDKIYTFSEVKNAYEIENDCEIEIDNDTMIQIINENIISVGGNIQILTSNNDNILKWCNDYAEYMEADRGMAQDEIEDSIRDIFLAINNKYNDILESTIDNLYIEEEHGDGWELYCRLLEIFDNVKIEEL